MNATKTNTVLDYLRINAYHLLGHGTGAEAALEIGRSMGKNSPRPPGPELEAVLSVTLASPVLGGASELPPNFLETLQAPYAEGGTKVCLKPFFSVVYLVCVCVVVFGVNYCACARVSVLFVCALYGCICSFVGVLVYACVCVCFCCSFFHPQPKKKGI